MSIYYQRRLLLTTGCSFGDELGIVEDRTQAGPEYVFGLGDTFGNGVIDSNGRDSGIFVPRRRSAGKSFYYSTLTR